MSIGTRPIQTKLAEALDKQAILELVRAERFYRDRGDWDALADCYTEDSHVRTTWFQGGTGQQFAEASREMAERRGRHSKHFITPMHVILRGDRALVESYGEIHNRSELDGVEVDTVQYCRFFSRVKRTPDGWRLASFDGLYQWDTIVPTNPAAAPAIDWDEMSALRSPYRVWAYMLSRKGYDVDQETIVADDRPDLLEAFYRDAEEWLAA